MRGQEFGGPAARGRDSRRELKELLVMVALGGPGAALFILGIKMFEWAGRVTFAGAVVAAAGALLFLACGYYHYRKDYRVEGGRRGIVTFLLLTLLPGFAGVLVALLMGGD